MVRTALELMEFLAVPASEYSKDFLWLFSWHVSTAYIQKHGEHPIEMLNPPDPYLGNIQHT